ncbi:MAG: hypothetical protein RDV48_21710 [Candidatus Eremiobacteraeota bacterium]|nr:hypothetical protein [Candidatus Eremiobacteraeota bacterium]
MSFFSLLLGFLPWIVFLIIAGHHSLAQLKIAILVSFVLNIIGGITKYQRGVIMWAGLAFFAFDTVAVVIFENMWVVSHMAVLASGTLFVAAFVTMLAGHPFVFAYARDGVDKKYWNSPRFLRTCYLITSVWCAVFLLNTLTNFFRIYHREIPSWIYEAAENTFLVSGALFTTLYVKHVKKKSAAMHKEDETPPEASHS